MEVPLLPRHPAEVAVLHSIVVQTLECSTIRTCVLRFRHGLTNGRERGWRP